ncbi:MAG TPA: glycosyltransferase 87 family protein [Patescibacteria group bacterium]|nr:glycosyltransferase 87 family protein [Patescibacteria group bacterium]
MSRRLPAVVAVLAFLVLTAVAAARVRADLVDPLRPALERFGMQDLRDNFYYPSVALLQGRNPYDVADYKTHYPIDRPLPAYSPISLLVHLPLALLPLGAAETADFVVNAALLLVLARVALAGAGAPVTVARIFGIAALMTLSRAGQQTLYIGQCAVYVALGSAIALVEARRRPWLAGAGIAIACLKPSYGLPLGFLMLCRRDVGAFVRGAGLAALAGIAGAVVPIAAAGGIAPFVASVRHGMQVVATDPSYHEATSLIRIDVGALFGRFLGRSPGAAIEILLGILILGSAGAILWTREARAAAGGGEREPRPAGDGLACLALLLGLYHQSYDALLLVLPVTALLFGSRVWRPAAGGTWTRAALLALLLVPWFNLLATHAVLNRVETVRALWLPLATANGAALLLAYLTWAWGMSRTAPPRSPP